MAAVTLRGDEARHLRWAGGAMVGAGLVLGRLPPGVGLPCPLRTVTGVPCPLCGMQTAVKATLAGDLVRAVAANPAGVVTVVVALVLLATRPDEVRLPPVPVLGVVLASMWAWELARFGLLPGT